MPKIASEQVKTEWTMLLDSFSDEAFLQVQSLINEHRKLLADHFYQQMMQDTAASAFLSHDLVKTRLNSSLQQWLVSLFSVVSAEQLQAVIAQQIKVGEVHARIGIPVYLVLKGVRHLKDKFFELLQASQASEDLLLNSSKLLNATIDIAMEVMSLAYANSHERLSRSEEAYRLFSVAQNIAYERDKQRALLLDWENHLMFDCAVGLTASQLPRIASSEFGLWFRHKGAHAFEGGTEATVILQAMQHIDDVLIPLFDVQSTERNTHLQLLRDLREQSKSIRYHLDVLFEQNTELESGRDVLTRLLNRKFLTAVMTKEVSYARQHNTTFAVLAIDIDHFKQINDNHGHEGGDSVLQQVATLFNNNSRGGDYLFRLGGEEFLMLVVDIEQDNAVKVAEKIRKQVASERFLLARDQYTQLSISIGLAMHNGHPDYERALRRADDALYKAKRSGRNCVVVAEDES